ncbi:unnamed protein product [Pleuronectes platessa]|uniref:Uncharacterized protein n=1 Tax=Pleuronectes platessa TaxID=8262 RepID=A0A9N7TRS4_PLEPL|nr:unnamed protein product [Pleuronectes platessa]
MSYEVEGSSCLEFTEPFTPLTQAAGAETARAEATVSEELSSPESFAPLAAADVVLATRKTQEAKSEMSNQQQLLMRGNSARGEGRAYSNHVDNESIKTSPS